MRLLCSIAVVLLSGLAGMPDEGAIDEVLRRSPVVRTSDPDVSAIDVRIEVAGPGISLSWRCLYRAPGDRMLMLRDGNDGTPIAWSDGTTMTIYDPFGGRLIVVPTNGPTVHAFAKDEESSIGMALFADREQYEAKVAEQGGEFWLALRSLVEVGTAERGEAVREEDGTLRASLVSKAGHEWGLTIEQDGAETRWTTRKTPDPDGSFFTFSAVANGPPEDRLFERCQTLGLIEELPVVELGDVIEEDRGLLEKLSELNELVVRISRRRLAIQNPDAREDLIRLLGDRELDWETLREQDRLASERLREFWDVSEKSDEAP